MQFHQQPEGASILGDSFEARLYFCYSGNLTFNGYGLKIGWGYVALKIVSSTKTFHEDRNILLIFTGNLFILYLKNSHPWNIIFWLISHLNLVSGYFKIQIGKIKMKYNDAEGRENSAESIMFSALVFTLHDQEHYYAGNIVPIAWILFFSISS